MTHYTRSLAIAANSFDAETRTFDAVISTGADVRRRDARGPFVERLDLSTVDIDALVGVPVLDGHRQDGSEHAVGTIVAAHREGASIVASVRLSAAEDVRSIATKVGEGVLRGVSIGYAAETRSESQTGATRVVTIRPRIHELSIVAIPADPSAIIRKESALVPQPNLEIETANDNVVQHRAAVRGIARVAGLPAEWADAQIDSDSDLITVRAAAFEALESRPRTVIRTHAAGPANDDPAVILERRADALFARVNGSAPPEASRQYMGDRIVDHARAILTMRGESLAGLNPDGVFNRAAAHTTSDFANLLTGVGNRALMPAYQAAQSPLKQLGRQSLFSDFRTQSRLKLSGVGALQKVTEQGEIKSTTRGEAAESYKLDTYGSMFALSRKALINDDLGAFRDWGAAAGAAAAETEANLLFTLLMQSSGAGPTMGEDGKRMFAPEHNNLAATGSVLWYYNSAATPPTTGGGLDAARIAMRSQKGLNGTSPINVTPKYLLVGPQLETDADRVLSQISAIAVPDVNPWSGKLVPLIEPRITDKSWYLFSDPAQLAVLEYAYLSSAQGPQIATRDGWEVLGTEFRVTLDFGCGAIDWRGAYRNPGL